MRQTIYQQQDVNFRQVQEVARMLPDAVAETMPGAVPDVLACVQGMASAVTGGAPYRFVCVAEGEGEMQGFLVAVLESDAFTSFKTARVLFKYVRPAFRQSRVLADMVAALEAWATTGDAREVYLEDRTGQHDDNATALLSSSGFERGGVVLRKTVRK